MNAYTEFISKLCDLAIKLKRVSLTDKEVENEKSIVFEVKVADVSYCD